MKKKHIFLITVICFLTFINEIRAEETEPKILNTTVTTVSPKESIPLMIDLTSIELQDYTVVLQSSFALSSYFEVPFTTDGLTTTFYCNSSYSMIIGSYTLGASTVETEVIINCKILDMNEEVIKEEILIIPIEEKINEEIQQPSFSSNGGSYVINRSSTISFDNGENTYNGSADNYLKDLSVEGYELVPSFNLTNSTYFINVDSYVEKIKVSCGLNSSSASYTVYGNSNLTAGLNKVLISITAENGSVRTYRIYVTKEAETNEEE